MDRRSDIFLLTNICQRLDEEVWNVGIQANLNSNKSQCKTEHKKAKIYKIK